MLDENLSSGESDLAKISFSSFNQAMYEKYDHRKLARFYIPIIYRALKEDNGSADLAIGVIEIGIKEEYDRQFSTDNERQAVANFNELLVNKYPTSGLFEKLLQLYTDNFAQPCYSAMVEEESDILLEELRSLKVARNNYSGLSYETYAIDVIRKITDWLGADYGVIALKTFNNNYINHHHDTGGTYFSDPRMRRVSE